MGMYTELLLKADVIENLPEEVEAVLQFLFNQEEEPEKLPTHTFFSLPRWECVGRMCSYYHIPWVGSQYKKSYIFSRSDLKDYDDEIANFIDWIQPYLCADKETCIGWRWYEEEAAPTLLFGKK